MSFIINDREVNSKNVFIIAEIGNNHNGSLDRALEMVDLAIKMGADCVKFQMRHMNEVYRERTLKKDGEDLGTEYVLDLLERFELSLEEHRKVFEYCIDKGIVYMCTPWDEKSLEVLEDFGVVAYKVASADLTNFPLIDKLSKTKKPLILSTGMSSEEEVKATVDFLNEKNCSYSLLHCNSTYPAPFSDIQLRWIESLRKVHPVIGYSGHERGIAVSLGAVALGAVVIERHFTLDRLMEGPDHAASLEYEEFKSLVSGVRELEKALVTSTVRKVSQGEMINRENLGKSLVASRDLSEGTVILEEHVKVRSPGQGLSPQKYENLLGLTLRRDMKEEDFFFPSDLREMSIEAKEYSYERPWGIPVRYHDFSEYNNKVSPDLYEFHLSYTDMDLDISRFLSGTYKCDFAVHAPELFSGSRLMDLASPDEDYRRDSIRETQRVIEITKELKQYFPKTKRPVIIANIGGFTMDGVLDSAVIPEYYERFSRSLKELDLEGVEFTPQTMAPFPWHFGGQRFQNLFVHADESIEWLEKLGLRVCFDVSHSMLTCNQFGYDIYEFSEKMAPYTAHIHLGDAEGINGEGLQIGQGEIDFKRLGEILRKGCPDASFIPEIWQGHKNGGEGFWIALEKLEGII